MFKKLFVTFTFLLPAFSGFSQEFENEDYTTFEIIPLLEGQGYFSKENLKLSSDLDLGNSALFGHFEGKRGNFGWLASCVFLYNAPGEMDWPYKNLGRADVSNFLNFFNVNYTLGDFKFTVGKDMIKTGGFEFKEWEWDCFRSLTSDYYNSIANYQWGASVEWQPLERQSFAVQALSSPWVERYFKGGLFAYSFQWKGSWDWADFLWSATAFQQENSKTFMRISLGQNFHITDKLDLIIDYHNCYDALEVGNTFNTKLRWAVNDKMQLQASYLYAKATNPPKQDYSISALSYSYFPIKNLRLHAIAAYDSYYEDFVLNIGARYIFSLLKKK